MDNDYYSLIPLLILIAVSFINRTRATWNWYKYDILLPLLSAAAVLFGIVMQKPLWAQLLGWLVFLSLHLPSYFIFKKARRAMSNMDAPAMARLANIMPRFFWGMPGLFWRDMLSACVSFYKGDAAAGAGLISQWSNNKDVPLNYRDIPVQYGLMGKNICWDWQGVLDDYELLCRAGNKPSPSICFMAARANVELGNYERAAHCLADSHFDETINPLDSLAVSLLPYFALCGAVSETKELIGIIKATRSSLPEALNTYWLARAYTKAGRSDEALQSFEQAQALSTNDLLTRRIEYARNLVDPEHPDATASRADVTAQVKAVWNHFQRGAFIQEILSPRRVSPLVNGILAVNIAVFSLINIDVMAAFMGGFFNMPMNLNMAVDIYKFGELDDRVIRFGEYWRLITYLFLHAGIMHVVLNMLGLHAFGRIAENIFGSARFLAIYFVGGILSGITHLLLNPSQPAVGASGAVLAIYGAVGVGIFKLKDVLPGSLRRRYLLVMTAFALVQLVFDQLIPRIASFAHIGGLISGMALGMITSTRTPSKEAVDGTQSFVSG